MRTKIFYKRAICLSIVTIPHQNKKENTANLYSSNYFVKEKSCLKILALGVEGITIPIGIVNVGNVVIAHKEFNFKWVSYKLIIQYRWFFFTIYWKLEYNWLNWSKVENWFTLFFAKFLLYLKNFHGTLMGAA